MDENAVRSLLADIAETPEPLSTRIDIDAARRAGRTERARRAIASALTGLVVALAVGMLVTVPHDLSLGPQRARPAAASQPSAQREATSPAAAPATFSPLVPYADFGPLPGGFAEQPAPQVKGGMSASLTTVVRTASQRSTGRQIVLTVSSAKACQGVTVHPARDPVPKLTTDCAFSGYGVTAKATAVNRRPSYWVNDSSLAWEYAPGGWAMLSPQVEGVQPVAEKGWGATPSPSASPSGAAGLKAKQAAAAGAAMAIKEGFGSPPPAATLTLLEQVASQVRFGQHQSLVFPFEYSGKLPGGARVTAATFYASGRTLIGTSVSVGPSTGPSALWISASAPGTSDCSLQPGDSVVRKLGMPWVRQVEHYSGSDTAVSLCSMMPGSPTAGLWVLVSATGNSFSADAVLAQLTFLGPSPSKWTVSPFE